MSTKLTSEKYKLNLEDLLQGFAVSFITAFVTGLYQLIESGAMPKLDDLKSIGLVSTGIGLAYLLKNYLTPQKVITTVKTLLLALIISGLSGCAFVQDVQRHTSLEVVNKPTGVNDTISVVAKFWGAADLIHAHAPQTKAGMWLRESTKHCSVSLASFPQDANDTIAIVLTCDSIATTVQQWLPAKKNHAR